MNRLTLALAVFAVLGAEAQATDIYTPGEPVRGDFKTFARGFLENNCFDCHDSDTTKGDLNLAELGPVDETNAAVWKSIWAQVTLQEMPPKKKSRVEIIDRLRFSDWIVSQLQREMKGKGGFSAHLDPNKGNFVSHDLLFGLLPKGIRLVPTASPARIWRVTPQEHITRLNELINTEPAFDPAKPGLRTRGDMVPTNHGGELKLYFGTDRIIRWEGGTVAYATAVKSVPVILSSKRKHGLENYPDFYTVNSSEATQILDKAEDILRYMAYGPMSLVGFPEQITDDPKTYDKIKPKGDIRGTPIAIVYNTKIVRSLTPIHDLMKEEDVTEERLSAAVNFIFEAVTFRPPTAEESAEYLQIVKDSIAKVGKEDGAFMGLSAIFLDRDALFRPELAASGKPDAYGRVMLQDWELGLAVNHALSYIQPDPQLRKAIVKERMRTREDVRREVTRMLADNSIRKPRVLRFFRDFFDYDLGGYICKDAKALASSGAIAGRGPTQHYRSMFDATASTDRLIELILQKDEDVLKELLTTQQVVATGNDKTYFGKKNNKEEREAATLVRKKEVEERLKKETAAVADLEKEINELESKLRDAPVDQVPPELLVNGSFSKVTFEEPDNWELEKGTLNQTELATGKVVAVRGVVMLEQTLSKPIASKTKLIVKATRTDSSSKAIRFTAIWDNGSHSANITPAIGQMELIVPDGKTMTAIQFNTYRPNHGISEVSLREDAGILKTLTQKKKSLAAAKKKLEQEKKKKVGSVNVTQAELSGPRVYARVSRRSFGNGSMKPERTLGTVPEGQRLGLLTHPSWLVSHSDAMDNHAILRGRWIRERLLGGGIPDVPITVDAMLPDEPQNTLRERMRVTREAYCWTCHKKMDSLGLPFEMYNHAGLFRTTELEKPVDTTGEIINSGVPELDGPVKNALEMIDRLAKSERVEQVFVRHAFRFWMGRNETLNDSPVLQAAHKAYRDNNGSMKALLTSLLTSDAFLFRNVERSKK